MSNLQVTNGKDLECLNYSLDRKTLAYTDCNLSDKRIDSFPNNFFNFQHLTWINLSHNFINDFKSRNTITKKLTYKSRKIPVCDLHQPLPQSNRQHSFTS